MWDKLNVLLVCYEHKTVLDLMLIITIIRVVFINHRKYILSRQVECLLSVLLISGQFSVSICNDLPFCLKKVDMMAY